MITTKLQGGLGNQMFQISAAYSLSRTINTTCEFDFNQCYTPNQGNTSINYQDNLFSKIKNSHINYKDLDSYFEPKFSYTEIPLIDNQCLYGFFQSEKYFINHSYEIRELFDTTINDQISYFLNDLTNNGKPITTIHVRRGDYLYKSDYHSVCSLEYYKNAMNVINNNKYIIISDDLEWCKENFKGDKFIFSPFNNEIDDLKLMVYSNNVIMSNSSFSWWGSYLNKNKHKIIVSPKQWFGPYGPSEIIDIIPNEWLIVN